MTSHSEQVSNYRIAHRHIRQVQGTAQTTSRMLLYGTESNIVWKHPVHENKEMMEMPQSARQRRAPERARSEVALREYAGNVDNHCSGSS